MTFLSKAQGLSGVVSRPTWTGAPSSLQSVVKDLSYFSYLARHKRGGGKRMHGTISPSTRCGLFILCSCSSSLLTEVFLAHRQQTQSLCSSVSHYATDLLPKFWSFTELTIEFISSVENGAVLPATLRWNSCKSCGRKSWLRAWGWDGRAAQPTTAGWPRRSSDGASAPSCPFTQNLMAQCVVR